MFAYFVTMFCSLTLAAAALVFVLLFVLGQSPELLDQYPKFLQPLCRGAQDLEGYITLLVNAYGAKAVIPFLALFTTSFTMGSWVALDAGIVGRFVICAETLAWVMFGSVLVWSALDKEEAIKQANASAAVVALRKVKSVPEVERLAA